MVEGRFQYGLRNLVLVVASAALVLGAARGTAARAFVIGTSVAIAVTGVATLLGLAVFVVGGIGPAGARRVAQLPLRVRRLRFERRLARLRPGNSSQRVRCLLGSPVYVEGFGDRTYWSYRVAGQRYVLSFDPRRLLAKYPNGLSRELPGFC